MRSSVWVFCGALVALAAARTDHDFEFDEAAEASASAVSVGAGPAPHERRPRRYVYDPHSPLCRALVCKKREVCVLRDAFTALCASKKDIQRKGELIVAAEAEADAAPDAPDSEDDDVFYEGEAEGGAARCVGCPPHARAHFLCGSDNRTYSSLCRLDLHNCVRRAARPARPVRLACRGFCPCTRRRAEPPPPPPPARRRLAQGVEGCALDKMANRLLDWFSVLMEEASASAPPTDGFPRECKPEVRWMFAHLDTDGDGALSAGELYALRHDERERCLRPFLSTCGAGRGGGGRGGRAGRVTRARWCGCLRRAARPCLALARARPALPGAYAPACDARGYYRPRQCHPALGVCWCVDAHGVELPSSRTKGAPACPGDKAETEAEGAPADDEDGAGSGDADLRF